MAIAVKLDDLLHDRRMTLTELADRIGMTLANLSILKTGKARAIRFSTLDAICERSRASPATFSSSSRSRQNASDRQRRVNEAQAASPHHRRASSATQSDPRGMRGAATAHGASHSASRLTRPDDSAARPAARKSFHQTAPRSFHQPAVSVDQRRHVVSPVVIAPTGRCRPIAFLRFAGRMPVEAAGHFICPCGHVPDDLPDRVHILVRTRGGGPGRHPAQNGRRGASVPRIAIDRTR